MLGCISICCTLDTQQGFAQPGFALSKKTVQNRTAAHLKEELGQMLVELAELNTQQIEKLAQLLLEIYARIQELADNAADGVFSGASHKKLQNAVLWCQQEIAHAREQLKHHKQQHTYLKEK